MQKTVLTQAVAMALATLGMGSAFAQSSLTLYGNADVSLDHVKGTKGVALAPALGAATVGLFNKGSVTRVSPSATSQTSYGIRGTEDLGGGFKASFVLEGQLNHDTGALSQDGRMFGRQSYVGLTTPFGEVRLGRQYAPIFYSTAVITGERFGATDLFIEGGATNNLMVRQDNQISYWLKAGGLTASVAYSPNAGSYKTVNPQRAVNNANSTTGGILGQANAGNESAESEVGRSMGLFANYAVSDALNFSFGYHQNEFDGARFGSAISAGSVTIPVVAAVLLDQYQAVNLGVKYVVPGNNIMLSATAGQGEYGFTNAGTNDLELQFMALGVRVPVNAWTFSAQASQIKFKNFTKGKDTGLMLGTEYALSKRTSLFARWVQLKDDEGTASNDAGFVRLDPQTNAPVGNLGGIVGGPTVVATALGFRETPVFAGAGLNPGGKTTYIGAGIRHSF
jgi:predicted porin